MLNMCQISSFMAATEGPVAKFSSFEIFEEKKRKSNLSTSQYQSVPKIDVEMGSFGQIRKKFVNFSASVGRFSIFSDWRSYN